MEVTINKEYQNLIDRLDAAITAYEDSGRTEIGLSLLRGVKEGIRMLGSRPKLDSSVEQFMTMAIALTSLLADLAL